MYFERLIITEGAYMIVWSVILPIWRGLFVGIVGALLLLSISDIRPMEVDQMSIETGVLWSNIDIIIILYALQNYIIRWCLTTSAIN